MSDIALAPRSAERGGSAWRWLVPAAIALGLLLFALGDRVPALTDYPDALILPFKDWLAALMAWIKLNFSWATRGLTAIVDVPLRFAFNLLAKGFKFGAGPEAWSLPRLSWVGVTLFMAWLGYVYGGVRLALLCGVGFLSLAVFKLWDNSMLTLARTAICVPLCAASALLLGICAYFSPTSRR